MSRPDEFPGIGAPGTRAFQAVGTTDQSQFTEHRVGDLLRAHGTDARVPPAFDPTSTLRDWYHHGLRGKLVVAARERRIRLAQAVEFDRTMRELLAIADRE